MNRVLIIGAGPAGILTAAGIAAIDPDSKVCVLDHRGATRRHYGLSIAGDAINAISKVLRDNFRVDNAQKHGEMRALLALLQSWKGRVISVKDIEESLAIRAHNLGVTILRREEYRHVLTTENMPKFLNSHLKQHLTPVEMELQEHFENAGIIIGADGAHSVVRQYFMEGGDEEKLVDTVNLQYFIEMKYSTLQHTRRRTGVSKLSAASCEGMAFETMQADKRRPQSIEATEGQATKPATIHFFVGKRTYEAFAEATDETSWNLETFQEKAIDNPIIESVARKCAHYVQGVVQRGGSCTDVKIKRLPITVYRSSEVVKVYEGRIIALTGDAASGAVFARGVNKAMCESSALISAIHAFLNRVQQSEEPVINEVSTIPSEFVQYAKTAQKIFANEKRRATFKAFWIQAARVALRYFLKPFQFVARPFTFLYRKIISRLRPEPSIGELMTRVMQEPVQILKT